jgi:two-component system, chemotaxis family, CheB/CheR fusion protein
VIEDNPDHSDSTSTVSGVSLGKRVGFPIVGIGASAGGLEAFILLLKALPPDTGMAFVLVQHLAPSHASALAEILSRSSSMPVMEVREEVGVEANRVYVIPPDRSMIIAAGALQLLPREGRGAHHPIDQFFRALAKEQRHQAIGVVLSGTANDGTMGLEEIKAEGGITFAQDGTAQHDGMPHSAIASGCVDFVLPPNEIAQEIIRIGRHPYTVPEVEVEGGGDKSKLADVIRILHQATGVDFTGYKFNTLYRRVTRRMVFQKMDGLAEYVQYLRRTPAELDALYQDILISVTSFFRDSESFDTLKGTVFNPLLKNLSRHDTVRLWTLGCSTGQEAYSLAMAFTEAAEEARSTVRLQLFASDLNAAGIEKARAGIYPKDIAQDVSPERLRRFFTEVDGNYRISKSIRDLCVFSRHNVLADPPFSRIDLISCRNLLIYLQPMIQQRIMPLLHYALKSTGCLWLGGSETIGGYRHLFDALDAKHKIYGKKPGSISAHGNFPPQNGGHSRAPFAPITAHPSDAAELLKDADRLLSTKFAPPAVVVSSSMDILQYRGDASPYLAPVAGKASLNLLKMLREGLLIGVRAAVLKAEKLQTSVRDEGLRIKSGDGYRNVMVEVIPMKAKGPNAAGFVILFEEKNEVGKIEAQPPPDPVQPTPILPPAADLEQELAATREYLQSVIEQQEAANEELQSANEEVQSANEELQSTNEELETSKEEIQSSNEELATVNDELNHRNEELNRLNNDLVNLLGSVHMAIVMLGRDLRVRRFTPIAEKMLNLIPSDIGRPFADIRLNLDGCPELEPILDEVLDAIQAQQFEVRDKLGRWYSLRLRPYRTLDNQIDGVVVMLVDIDAMKRSGEFTESIVATVREPLLVLDGNLRVRIASRAFYEKFHISPENTVNRYLFELGDHDWDIPELRQLLEEILPQNSEFKDFEVEHEFKDLGKRVMTLNARRLLQLGEEDPSILLAIEDISERTQAEQAVRKTNARFEALIDASPVGIYLVDADFRIKFVSRSARPVFGNIGQLIGRDFVEVIHILWPEAYADEIVQLFRKTLQTGEPYTTTERIEQRLDRGVTEYYEWQINRILLPEGGFGVVCYFRDISTQAQARAATVESEQRLRFVMDSAPQKIFTARSNGDVNYLNSQWIEFTGLPFDQLCDSGWQQCIHADDVAETKARWQKSIDNAEPFQIEHRFRRHDGDYHWHLSRSSPLCDVDGKVVMWVGSNTDIHEVKEADRRKNEFLSMLAHELRNPLAPIRNAVQILRRTSDANESVQSAASMLERQIGQMVRLVDDLLDVSRISRGKIELRRAQVELASIVHHSVEAADTLVESKNQNLTVTLPPQPVYLNADPARLAQVLGNLLSNASKFTREGGRISMTVEVDGDHAIIRVRDSGIGIAPSQLPHIFDLFMQGDSSLERSVSGLGIGLTLVKTLVELHQGTVVANSTGLGQGSEIVVSLPISSESSAPFSPLPSTVNVSPTAVHRILVVDDNLDSAQSLALLLELTGNQTHIAHDGLEAVDMAEKVLPDLILLDIGLPKLNGFEVCRRIRQQPWGKNIVVVALSGWGQDQDRQKSKEAGFDRHLVKPVDEKTLLDLLASLPSLRSVSTS